MGFNTLSGGLELVIPTNGTTNWGTVLLNSTWTKINDHAHTGGGDGNKIGTGALEPGSVDKSILAPNLALTQAAYKTPAGTTETIDWDDGNKQGIDLSSATGTVALTLSNPIEGATYRIEIIQGATERAIAWPGAVLFPGGEEPAQHMSATDRALVFLEYNGTDYLADWDTQYS